LKKQPYLCYPYLSEKILYDPKGFAKKIKLQIREYFKKNPKAKKLWQDWEKDYAKKKKQGKKIKPVEVFYKELEGVLK